MLIGFVGKMGCGKTTTALILMKHLLDQNKSVSRRAFGDALKEEVSKTFNFHIDIFYYEKHKILKHPLFKDYFGVEELTAGKLLQLWGTDIRRKEDKNYWINKFHSYVSVYEFHGQNIILTDDIRFPNELEYFKRQNGLIFKIYPYPGWEKKMLETGRDPDHPSETALDHYPDDIYTGVFRPNYGLNELEKVAKTIELSCLEAA